MKTSAKTKKEQPKSMLRTTQSEVQCSHSSPRREAAELLRMQITLTLPKASMVAMIADNA